MTQAYRLASLNDLAALPIVTDTETGTRAWNDTLRLAEIHRLTVYDATQYVSGPAARDYLDLAAYRDAGISVVWKDYGTYPDYAQLHGPFVALP